MATQHFWHLGYPNSTAKLAAWVDDDMDVEQVWCPENALHQRAGKRLTDLSVTLPRRPVDDFVWTWYSECLIQARVLTLFRDHGFTGFDVKPVRARFKKPCRHELPVLWELAVTGWGGMAPPESGVRVVDHCRVCKCTVYSACATLADAFDPIQWDGSDFFFVWPLPTFIWVTERVAQTIRDHRLKGAVLKRPEEFVIRRRETDKVSPGRLHYRLPEARARELCETSGID